MHHASWSLIHACCYPNRFTLGCPGQPGSACGIASGTCKLLDCQWQMRLLLPPGSLDSCLCLNLQPRHQTLIFLHARKGKQINCRSTWTSFSPHRRRGPKLSQYLRGPVGLNFPGCISVCLLQVSLVDCAGRLSITKNETPDHSEFG